MEQDNKSAPPKQKNKGFRILWVLVITAAVLISVIYCYNYFTLQRTMNSVIEKDSRNTGLEVSVRYDSYVNISRIVYDLREFEGKQPIDIFRALPQFAEAVKERDFNMVTLSCKGRPKFQISGEYFKKLGTGYSEQNSAFQIRTFSENLLNLDGSKAYQQWSGGKIEVLKQQLLDFNDFMGKWTETK
jgi:hypothetical protein